jgi:hypothetical protein
VRSALAGELAVALCLPCPSAVQRLGGGGVLERDELTTSYRLYNCRRCAAQVRICRSCDRGNLSCAGDCAQISRLESVRRAGARYQRTCRGARCHGERQRRLRTRLTDKVTHQGYRVDEPARTVCASAMPRELTDAPSELLTPTAVSSQAPTLGQASHCAFCGQHLSAWARLYLWRWSG